MFANPSISFEKKGFLFSKNKASHRFFCLWKNYKMAFYLQKKQASINFLTLRKTNKMDSGLKKNKASPSSSCRWKKRTKWILVSKKTRRLQLHRISVFKKTKWLLFCKKQGVSIEFLSLKKNKMAFNLQKTWRLHQFPVIDCKNNKMVSYGYRFLITKNT